jgi:hypothetical protein
MTIGSSVTATGAVSGSGIGSFGSLVLDGGANLQNAGITNAGAIAGATTIGASGNITTTGGFVSGSGYLAALRLVIEGQTALDKNRNATLAEISGSGTLEVGGNAYFGSALNVSGTLYVSSSTPPRGSLAAVMTRAATTDAFPLEVLRLEVPDTATAGVNTTIGMGPKLSFYTPNSSEPGGSFEGAYIAAEKENTGDARDDMSLTLATCPQSGTVTERMRINSDGNVGINTQQPTNTLEIVGTVSGSSTLEIVGNATLGGNLNVSGAQVVNRTAATTTYSVTATDYYIGCNTNGGAFTVTLPATSGLEGRILWFKDEQGEAGTNTLTLSCSNAETLDGQTTRVIDTNYGSLTMVSDGSNWFII